MFRPHGVIIMLASKTYQGKYYGSTISLVNYSFLGNSSASEF